MSYPNELSSTYTFLRSQPIRRALSLSCNIIKKAKKGMIVIILSALADHEFIWT